MSSKFSPLFKTWESFFTRRLYHRVQDCWNRPISSSPGTRIDIIKRTSQNGNCTLQTTTDTINCLNLGSYNYLGFADNWLETCGDAVMSSLYDNWRLSMCSSRADFGNTCLHEELEEIVAKFVGKESAIVFTMGYNTNLSTIPCLIDQGTLLISDKLNHTSLVNGARNSKANVRVFEHNDSISLENIIREAIVKGQPKFARPWKKIVVLVEGKCEGDDYRLTECFVVIRRSLFHGRRYL